MYYITTTTPLERYTSRDKADARDRVKHRNYTPRGVAKVRARPQRDAHQLLALAAENSLMGLRHSDTIAEVARFYRARGGGGGGGGVNVNYAQLHPLDVQ